MSDSDQIAQDTTELKFEKTDQRHSKWGKLNRDATLNPFGFIDILKQEGGRPETSDTDYSESQAIWWDEGSPHNDKSVIDDRLEKSRFKLGKLDFSDCGLVHPLPTRLYRAFELRIMQLNHNNLTALSPAISWATALIQLKIYANQLIHLPEEIGLLKKLEILWVHDNHLIDLPDSIGKLSKLVILTLQNNRLTALPFSMCNCTKLTEVNWSGNAILSPPREIYCKGVNETFQYMQYVLTARQNLAISFQEADLSFLPADANIPGLTSLSMRGNSNFRSFPRNVTFHSICSTLTHLDLAGCLISQLPARCKLLFPCLETFLLDWENIIDIPSEILAMPWKRIFEYQHRIEDGCDTGCLRLDGFMLSDIPFEVFSMTHLTSLSLDNTGIYEIPPFITQLASLRKLSAQANNINSLPVCIQQLQSLERIYLCGNPITDLPLELCLMTNLTELYSYTHDVLPIPDGVPKLTAFDPEHYCNAISELYAHNTQLNIKPLEAIKIVADSDNEPPVKTSVPPNVAPSELSSPSKFLSKITQKKMAALKKQQESFSSVLIQAVLRRALQRDEMAYRRGKVTLMDQLRPLLAGPPMTFDWSSFFEFDTNGAVVNHYPPNFTRSQHVFNTFRILDSFEKMLIGTNTGKVDFNGMGLSYFPREILQCSALHTLDISNNHFQNLPEAVSYLLTGLTTLTCSKNNLEVIPSQFSWMKCLISLQMSYNKISVIPNDLGDCVSLTELDFHNNIIEELPMSISQLLKLKYLDFSHNCLKCFPSLQLGSLSRLEVCNLSNNNIKRWIGCNFSFFALRELLLNCNPLSNVPWEIHPGTPALTRIVFDTSRILSPDPEITIKGPGTTMKYIAKVWSCFSTKCLDIRTLSLKQFPSEVWKFPFLTRIRASENKIAFLPKLFQKMTLLTDLDVSHNVIRCIPVYISHMSQLKHLNFESNPIFWPPIWVRHSGFVYMFKWMQRLIDVAQKCETCGEERFVNFDFMMLKQIPVEILDASSSTNIRNLMVESEYLQSVQPDENIMKKGESPLNYVNRWDPNAYVGNPRSEAGNFGLIGGISHWGKITSLSLQSNRIRVLPPLLRLLSHLKNLNANFNRLRYIHPDIFKIPLQQLHLIENNLVFLPHSMLWCTSMTEFNYDGNPLDLPPNSYSRRRLKIYDTWKEYFGEFMSCRGEHIIARPFPNKAPGAPGQGYLDLRNFGLPKLPMEIFYKGGGNSSTCPYWFDYNTCITHLDIRENPISHLPACIVQLINLKHAIFSLTLIRNIPSTMAFLKHLEILEAAECVIASIPMDQKLRLPSCPDILWPKLQQLILHSNKIVHISLLMTEAIQIQDLDLRNNGISEIPLSICHMWNLKRLDLRENPILRIPFEMGRLSTVLTDLLVDLPAIWSPPPEVMTLGIEVMHRYLRAFDSAFATGVLHLPHFDLTRAPPEVMELRSILTELWLDNNKLETLPTIYGHLTNLLSLHVECNMIVRLPEIIGIMIPKMTDLNVSDNRLALIPLEYANLRKLKVFEVKNNPWLMLPAEIISKNLQAHYMYRVADSSNNGVLMLAGFYVTSAGLVALKSALPDMDQIREVYLEENSIVYIPKQFSIMTSITTLNLSKNQLSEVPDFIDCWKNMKTCFLQCNNIKQIPEIIGTWTNCTTLILSRNFLSNLPDSMRFLTSLTTLFLDMNRLEILCPAIGFITTLTELRLNLNNITILPPEMAQLTALQKLRLEGNNFKSPPPSVINGFSIPKILAYLKLFLEMKKTRKLDMSKQSWKTVPWEACYFQDLEIFNLSDNKLLHLIPKVHNGTLTPKEIQNFVSLQGLKGLHDPECDFTEMQAMHPSLSTLNKLQILNILGNSLTALPTDLQFCTSLTEFDIRQNCIEIVPFYLQSLKCLVTFRTEGNCIRHPPSEYGETLTFDFLRQYWEKIQNCETSGILTLPMCKLLMFPPEISENDSLYSVTTHIYLANNSIRILPPSCVSLQQLRHLDVSHNLFTEIQPWISQLLKIEEINYSFNFLTNLPEELGNSTSMKIIRCHDNRIRLNTAFWIRGMISLEVLDLTNNDLVSLPINLGFLKNFRDIGFAGNNLLDPPQRIIDLGLNAVLDFMRYNAKYEQSVESVPEIPQILPPTPVEDIHWMDCSKNADVICSDSFQPNVLSLYEPNPASMCADGVETSHWRTKDVGAVSLVLKFNRRAFIHRIELHWYSYFAGKAYSISASNDFGSQGSRAAWITVKDENGETFKHADLNRVDVIPFHGCPTTGIKAIRLSISTSMFKGNRLRHFKAFGVECDNDEFDQPDDTPFSFSRRFSKADQVDGK